MGISSLPLLRVFFFFIQLSLSYAGCSGSVAGFFTRFFAKHFDFSLAELNKLQDKTETLLVELKKKSNGSTKDQIEAEKVLADHYEQLLKMYNIAYGQGIFKYKAIRMDKYYLGETESSYEGEIGYIPKAIRDNFQVHVKDGLLYRSNDNSPLTSAGRMMFVMSPRGEIYMASESELSSWGVQKARHSSFLLGEPVASAGMIQIENGKITFLSRNSGHYLPTKGEDKQFLSELDKQGVPNAKRIQIAGPDEK